MSGDTKPVEVDVAIVGGGPAGVMAAKYCGIHGLSAAVFDRAEDVYNLPQVQAGLEALQRPGVMFADLELIEIASRQGRALLHVMASMAGANSFETGFGAQCLMLSAPLAKNRPLASA